MSDVMPVFEVTVNSSVNFVIYCIFGEKFKRIFLKSLCLMVGNTSPSSDIVRYPHSRHQAPLILLSLSSYIYHDSRSFLLL
jgi:hypothetical protein